ncbi:MAG: hypothetical protein JXA91_06555 [Candidatus Thermoplasmatota archaeon]|nr:hypothetical protein [Candidatus Thermoplasmatota archaeon]
MRIDEITDVNRTRDAPIPRKIGPTIPLTFADIINEISPRGPVANPQRSAILKGTLKRININVNINPFEKIAMIKFLH